MRVERCGARPTSLFMGAASSCLSVCGRGGPAPASTLASVVCGCTCDAVLCITKSCPVQVADFGLSVCLGAEASHASNQHHGTALYIAPEVLREGRKSMASDMYAYGVMLWELVHGVRAWDHYLAVAPHLAHTAPVGAAGGEQQQQQLGEHLFSLNAIPGVPPEFLEVVRACMAVDPASRPTFETVCSYLCDMYLRYYHEAG